MARLKDCDVLSKAPSLGQHTKEILKSLGYTDSQLVDLINKEVVK